MKLSNELTRPSSYHYYYDRYHKRTQIGMKVATALNYRQIGICLHPVDHVFKLRH